ncbi:MAG: type II secretion system GspH family protein [Nitrospiraceae bacterium]|nr:type II secretion system GspH family protein [Nitrospiraceae bacterium]
MKKLASNKKGFSLIELIITMVLIGIVAYVVASSLSTGIKAFFITDNRKEALDQARIAMERMTREIRNTNSLGRDSDGDGFIDATITTATANSFCFTNTENTIVSFRLLGTNIMRGQGSCFPAGENVLANNVTALNFQYILANGTSNSSPANPRQIRRVQIGWAGTPGISVLINNQTVSITSMIYLRNLP